ncbi:hypothetical protein WN51_06078 [Melipona quadrifasciata]|uniref:Uncharacterized protein n=1 Tax=Melipona quadrifasciata TaxID=166423 RepID=A0A0N0BBX7_9HYME|nr:hypothetical protein WN51_06078 [Melipona quadrifasciata]
MPSKSGPAVVRRSLGVPRDYYPLSTFENSSNEFSSPLVTPYVSREFHRDSRKRDLLGDYSEKVWDNRQVKELLKRRYSLGI